MKRGLLQTSCILLAAAATLGYFFAGIRHAQPFSVPLSLLTTGEEEGALFGIWRVLQGEQVYQDPFAIPYAGSFFGWLFYASYGLFTQICLRISGLDIAWFPQFARSFSTIGALLGCFALFRIFKRLHPAQRFVDRLFYGGLALLVFFGLSMGRFSWSTRPDIWALSLELLALLYLLSRIDEDDLIFTAIAIALLCFVASSFRQTNMTVFLCAQIFLAQKSIRAALIGALVFGSLWGFVLIFGGELFRYNILFAALENEFAIRAHTVLLKALKSSQYLALSALLALGLLAVRPRLRRAIFTSPEGLVLGSSVIISLLIGVATGSKIGAATNYYHPFLAFLCCFVVYVEYKSENKKLFAGAWTAGAFLMLLFIVPNIRSYDGPKYSLIRRPNTPALVKRCIDRLPAPVFSEIDSGNLPTINPGPEYFVLSYSHQWDKTGGRAFERGGIPGLLRDKYFGSVVLIKAPKSPTFLDRRNLRGYKLREGIEECRPYIVFVKREDPDYTHYARALRDPLSTEPLY